ncbi:MAG: AIR carboxylase family protein, partial [Phascolarctobacterium sp.]|nr:AIR carboxylase family protein [Phascolarctobacterium sp.]
MITGELKNKIDGLWDIFAAGGLVNPLDVIEQITYLMFIHDLDEVDNRRAKESAMLGLPYQSMFAETVVINEREVDGRQLKWSVFHDYPAGKMYSVMQEYVFPFIKQLHGDKNSAYSKYMDDAIFKLPTPLLLSKVITTLDEMGVPFSVHVLSAHRTPEETRTLALEAKANGVGAIIAAAGKAAHLA